MLGLLATNALTLGSSAKQCPQPLLQKMTK